MPLENKGTTQYRAPGTFSLWNMMGGERLGEAPKLQKFFDDNGIKINLQTNEGLENVLRVGGAIRGEEDCDFFFPKDMDMTEMRSIDMSKKLTALGRMKECLTGFQEDMSLYIYKEGEELPRRLSKNDKGDLELSDPLPTPGDKPKKPGFWMRLAHFFGFYDEEFRQYERDLAQYNQRKALFEDVTWTKKARDGKLAPEDDEEKKKLEEQEKQREKMADVYEKCLDDIQNSLDKAFGEAERSSYNAIDRLDHVMINGKPLSAMLMEETMKETGEIDSYDYLRSNNRLWTLPREDIQHRANEIMLNAMLKGETVRYMNLDPTTGKPVRDEKGTSLSILEKPEHLAPMDKSPAWRRALAQFSNEKVWMSYGVEDDKNTLLQKMVKCEKTMQRNNYLERAFMYQSASNNMKEQLFAESAKEKGQTVSELIREINVKHNGDTGMTYDRSTLPSHAIALLLANGMSLEDIADPTKCKEEKAAAGKEVLRNLEPSVNKKWFAETNLKGGEKLREILNEKWSHVNVMDDRSLFAPGNEVWLAATATLFDLQQERGHFKNEFRQAVADKYQLPSDSLMVDELHEDIMNKTQVLASLKGIAQGAQAAAECSLGNGKQGFETYLSTMVTGEMMRSKLVAAQKQGLPAEQFTTDYEASLMSAYGGLMHSDPLYQKITDVKGPEERSKFAESVLSGEFRNHYHMDLFMKDKETLPEVRFMDKREMQRLINTPSRTTRSPQYGRQTAPVGRNSPPPVKESVRKEHSVTPNIGGL